MFLCSECDDEICALSSAITIMYGYNILLCIFCLFGTDKCLEHTESMKYFVLYW